MISSGTKLGPYEVTGSLGAGGMGEVYSARDSRLGREVAIKVLPESLAHDSDRLRRFEQEARIVSALNHPNVVAVFDVGEQGGMHYLVSELLEGETLRQRIGDRPLPARKVKEYGLQIARGLAAAHDKGMIHRDLKPENIFVTRDEQVKLLDFGLAKPIRVLQAEATATATKTLAGVVLGTVGYMSPEQVRGGAIDHRTDIFSFGTVLYEMMSGHRAFHAQSSIETMNAILKEDPPDLDTTAFVNSPGLQRVLRRCLEKVPERRFQSASDLAFAIEALSESASATSAPQIAVGTNSRRAWLVAGIVGLALCVAAAVWAASSLTRPSPAQFTSLVFGPGYISSARFTPGAASVVYGAAWNGKHSKLFEVKTDGTGQRSLGLPPAEVMGVSENGDLAISLDRHHQFQWVAAGTLARAPLGGQAARPLLDRVCDADISPDGKQFAIVACTLTEQTLEFPVGRVLYRTNGYVDRVRISRGGDRIAFADHPIYGDDRGYVSVIDADGKNMKHLTNEWASIKGLTWSPSGDEIWFSGNSGTRVSDEVWGVSLAGKQRRVLAAPADVWIQDATPSGKALLLSARSTSEIIMHRFGRDKDEGLDLEGSENVVTGISDDGKLLLVNNTGAGSDYETEIVDAENPIPVLLGEGNACAMSPDGKFVISSLPSTPNRIILYPTGTGETRKLDISPVRNTGVCSWSSAGKVVFTGDEPGKGERAYMLDLSTGSVRPVTPEHTTGAMVSRDGRLVVAKENGSFFVYPVAGGKPEPVRGLDHEESPVGWHQSGRKLFVWNGHFPARVFLVDFETGKRERWAEFNPPESSGLLWGSMVITPDGRSYSYRYRRILTSLFIADKLR